MIVNSNQAYVYKHIRLDTKEVFYIGVGFNKIPNTYYRSYDTARRNNFWYNVINKTDFLVEIVVDNLDYTIAKEIEKWFIKFYGRKDLNTGTLVNLTDGGEGRLGFKASEATRAKSRISKSLHPTIMTKEIKEKISRAKTGVKQSITSVQKRIKTRELNNKPQLGTMILNTETGIYYVSVAEAARAHNLNVATLHDYVGRRSKTNKTSLIKV